MTEGTPRAWARLASSTARSMVRLATPGIEAMGLRVPRPSITKSG